MGIAAVVTVDALFVVLGVFAHFVGVEIARSYPVFLVMIIRAIFVIMGLFNSTGVHLKER